MVADWRYWKGWCKGDVGVRGPYPRGDQLPPPPGVGYVQNPAPPKTMFALCILCRPKPREIPHFRPGTAGSAPKPRHFPHFVEDPAPGLRNTTHRGADLILPLGCGIMGAGLEILCKTRGKA